MTIWLGLGMSIVLRLIKCDKKCDKEWHMQANDGCKDFIAGPQNDWKLSIITNTIIVTYVISCLEERDFEDIHTQKFGFQVLKCGLLIPYIHH